MTMSEGDVRKDHEGKKHAKKKGKKGARPAIKENLQSKDGVKVTRSKKKSMQLEERQKMTLVEEPSLSVEETPPHPKGKKGKKRKMVEKPGSNEEPLDANTVSNKNSKGGEKKKMLGEKQENMDQGKPDGAPSEEKKKIRKKQKLERNDDASKSEDNLESKVATNVSEEGNTENGDQKPLPKRKGKNKKKKKKPASKPVQGDAQRLCLRYLQLWDKDKTTWHFQKVRQVWLLQNMYDKTKIPKSEFHILLRYLENLRGKAREVTIKYAEGLIEKLEDKIQNLENEEKSSGGEEEEDADEGKKMKVQWRRASDILQTLS